MVVRMVGDSMELVRVRIADGAERPLTDTPGRDESWPYWTPLAQALVFQTSTGPGDSDLALWSSRTGEHPLTRTPKRAERWAAWAPNGPRLVFAFLGGNPASGLSIADLGSRGRHLAASGGTRDFYLRPGWAPDGESLVAQRRGEDGKGSNLWIVEVGGTARALTSDPALFDFKPFFTRDGRRIVFSRRPAAGPPHDVLSIAPDGSDLRSVAGEPDADEHSGRPSPVREELAFVSDRDGNPQVYRAQLDGSAVRRLTQGPRSALAPRWSPDGERLVVTLASTPELKLVDRAALAEARVAVIDREGAVLLETAGFMPDWMPPWP